MKHPPFRVVPPSPAQFAADPLAPAIVFTTVELEALTLATAALGFGYHVERGVARMALARDDLSRLASEMRERGQLQLAGHIDRYLAPVAGWHPRGRALPLDRPYIMGILNLTDDSFSGDGVGRDHTAALAHAAALREAGADIIDVGAESARADRPVLDETEEAALVTPVIEALAGEGHTVSIDTYKPGVARAAVDAGAHIVNDISGLTRGTGAAEAAARGGAGYVLNYSYSVPKRRPDKPPRYTDVVVETLAWMFDRVDALRALGLDDDQIVIDPGIAFGKSHAEDMAIISRLGELTSLGLPVLLAHSRKNFIGSVSGLPPSDRDLETHIATALAYEQGARIFRVHDPAGARRALTFAAALTTNPLHHYAPDAESWPWRAGASAAHMTTAAPDKPAPSGQRW
ncbi:MAG: dihydropteroate synthase [Dehalococcoidia bacterium]